MAKALAHQVVASAPRYIVEAAAVALLAALAVALCGARRALVLIGGIALGGMRVLPLLQTAYRNWAMMAANRAIVGDVLELLRLPMPAGDEPAPAPLPFQGRSASTASPSPTRAPPPAR